MSSFPHPLSTKGFDNSANYIIYCYYSKKLTAKWYTLGRKDTLGYNKSYISAVKTSIFGTEHLSLTPGFVSFNLSPWDSYSISLCFRFYGCKMRTIMDPTLQIYGRNYAKILRAVGPMESLTIDIKF